MKGNHMTKIVTKEYFDARIQAFQAENESLNTFFTTFVVKDIKNLSKELLEEIEVESPAYVITEKKFLSVKHNLVVDSEKFIGKVSEETFEFVLYHELGHIKCEHHIRDNNNKRKPYFQREAEADLYAVNQLNITPKEFIKHFISMAKTDKWYKHWYIYLQLIPRTYFLNKKYKESKNS